MRAGPLSGDLEPPEERGISGRTPSRLAFFRGFTTKIIHLKHVSAEILPKNILPKKYQLQTTKGVEASPPPARSKLRKR